LLQFKSLRAIVTKLSVLVPAAVATSLTMICVVPSSTESAAANGDTRTLHFYHTHTGETIDATFRVDGHYDTAVLRQLNHFLRDWRNNDEHEMDPRLFDAVWEAYRTAGATDRIQIYSAYRSPDTNAMLRRRSHAVAEHSQHMLGKAMDTTMPGFPMQRIREAGMKLEHGGVGWYPASNFVHLDVGSVRAWPRMSYDQLARIFPDGKTVHIAADGRTLPGYDQARIEIAERGGAEVPPPQQSRGFFAWLFNGGSGGATSSEDEEDRRAPVVVAANTAPTPKSAPPAAAAQAPIASSARTQEVASLDDTMVPVGDKPLALAGLLPLPPRRPADLADAPNIPLPPIRPDALDRTQTASIRFSETRDTPARPDAIGSMITATASGVPMIRRSSLPAIITRGGDDDHALVPSQALAFASADTVPDLRPVPLPIARPSGFLKPLALRSARRRITASVPPAAPVRTAVADAVDEVSDGLAGPRLMGLRRAARLMTEKASL
jgi:uncharacterized protein YcbK (DUF882 family)